MKRTTGRILIKETVVKKTSEITIVQLFSLCCRESEKKSVKKYLSKARARKSSLENCQCCLSFWPSSFESLYQPFKIEEILLFWCHQK